MTCFWTKDQERIIFPTRDQIYYKVIVIKQRYIAVEIEREFSRTEERIQR